jgi:hypothetical protein
MRVFLHDAAWREDPAGFMERLDQFLSIADRHRICVLPVIFDACWNPYPRTGTQPKPRPFVHNSGWVQSPGEDILCNLSAHAQQEPYVKSLLARFGNDPRIMAWDLFNEPGNPNASSYGSVETPFKVEMSQILLQEVFAWAREAHPRQPLTAAVWGDWSDGPSPSPLSRYMLGHSDIITFHCYKPLEELERQVAVLRGYGRPVMCTEYMARPKGSRFSAMVPYFKSQGITCYNWGFVSGKTQTIYPWDSWQKAYTAEPPEWFHDVLRGDGSPYKSDEYALLQRLLLDGRP